MIVQSWSPVAMHKVRLQWAWILPKGIRSVDKAPYSAKLSASDLGERYNCVGSEICNDFVGLTCCFGGKRFRKDRVINVQRSLLKSWAASKTYMKGACCSRKRWLEEGSQSLAKAYPEQSLIVKWQRWNNRCWKLKECRMLGRVKKTLAHFRPSSSPDVPS